VSLGKPTTPEDYLVTLRKRLESQGFTIHEPTSIEGHSVELVAFNDSFKWVALVKRWVLGVSMVNPDIQTIQKFSASAFEHVSRVDGIPVGVSGGLNVTSLVVSDTLSPEVKDWALRRKATMHFKDLQYTVLVEMKSQNIYCYKAPFWVHGFGQINSQHKFAMQYLGFQ